MPRRNKGARLWLRPARRNKGGKVTARPIWVILDNGKHVATGCAEGEAERAEQVLAAYITQKYRPDRRERDLETIDVADVLSIYVDDRAHKHANQRRFRARIARLNDFWGGMTLANVTGVACRRYAKHRGNSGGPEKGPPRDRWLTRGEAARLLWACWRTREVQTAQRGTRKGSRIETERYRLRHIARFILIALYMATRPVAVMSASFLRGMGRSYVDLERGIFYRLAEGRRASQKREPPVPLPPRLLAHMRLWARLGIGENYLLGMERGRLEPARD
jgi:hypothetical protein